MKMALLAAISIGFIGMFFFFYVYEAGLRDGKDQMKKEREEWLKPGATFHFPSEGYIPKLGEEKKTKEETTI